MKLLTVEYIKFNHRIEMQTAIIDYLPSFTYCFDPINSFDKIDSRMKLIKEIFLCFETDNFAHYYSKCQFNNFYLSFKSSKIRNNLCFTLLNDKDDQQQDIAKYYSNLRIYTPKFNNNYSLQIHHYYEPAIFDKNKIFYFNNKKDIWLLYIRITRRQLLPHPYSTDCRIYNER